MKANPVIDVLRIIFAVMFGMFLATTLYPPFTWLKIQLALVFLVAYVLVVYLDYRRIKKANNGKMDWKKL